MIINDCCDVCLAKKMCKDVYKATNVIDEIREQEEYSEMHFELTIHCPNKITKENLR